MSKSLDRMHYTCLRCGHQTPIPDDWKKGDPPPYCEGCGDNEERRAERARERREAEKKANEMRKQMNRDLARITDEDRERWAMICKERGREVTPFLKCGYYIPEYGRQGWMVECSCGEYFRLFEWSFHGKGKKCPGCRYHHSKWFSVLPQKGDD